MVCLDISELCWTEPAFPDVTLSSSSSSLRDLSTILPPPFPDSSSIWSSITTHDLDPTPSSCLDSVQSSMRYQVSPTASFLYPYYQSYDAFSSLFRSFADDEQVDISPVVRSASLNDVDRWFWPEAASEREVSVINSYSFTSVESSSSLSCLSDHSDVILDISDEITEIDESASTPSSPSLSYTGLFFPIEELSQSTSVTLLCHIHGATDLIFQQEESCSSPTSPSLSYTELFLPVDKPSTGRQTPVIPLSQSCTSFEHFKEQSKNTFSSNQQSRKRKREEEEDQEGETNKHRRR